MPTRPLPESNSTAATPPHGGSRETLYALLNVPVSASQDNIRHRYKELAVIFHPDRQRHRDDASIKLAEDRFRQIQKAYEILTDPVRRQIYDALGEEGLAASNAIQKRFNSVDELRSELERLLLRKKSETFSVTSKGRLTCALDITNSLQMKGLVPQVRGIKKTLLRVEHTMGLRLRDNTDIFLTGQIQASPLPGTKPDFGNLIGTVRHQFSPRVEFEASANLYRLHKISFKSAYSDRDNSVSAKVDLSPRIFPRLTLEVQRRLFPASHTTGTLTIATGRIPTFTAMIGVPLESDRVFMWGTGIRVAPLPSLVADVTTKPVAGGFKGRFVLECGLLGLKGTVYGLWSSTQKYTVSVAVGSGNAGPMYTEVLIDISGHQLAFPIILSYEIDVIIGLCAVLVPSAFAGIAHNLLIRPWLRARRISQWQSTRKVHSERIRQKKEEAERTVDMLSDHAHRRVEYERSIGGLVILSGTYIASGEEGEETVAIDVTIPLQVQVHDSQLTIPGGRSKAGLVGFHDPLPGARKRLKIEYLFHDALHVVEVGDFSSVVLPLKAHLVG